MTAAEQIRAARGDISRAAAARLTGIPLRTLEDWEAGRRTPPGYTLRALLECLERAHHDDQSAARIP